MEEMDPKDKVFYLLDKYRKGTWPALEDSRRKVMKLRAEVIGFGKVPKWKIFSHIQVHILCSQITRLEEERTRIFNISESIKSAEIDLLKGRDEKALKILDIILNEAVSGLRYSVTGISPYEISATVREYKKQFAEKSKFNKAEC